MSSYFARTPLYFQKLWPGAWFRIPVQDRSIYLSFDDGPTAGVTPFVLEELEKFGAKASFFCLGSQAIAQPKLLKEIHQAGHSLGNHCYTHLDGWQTNTDYYEREIKRTDEVLNKYACKSPKLYRPPYGRITPFQAYRLRQEYQLVFWEVMPGDFDSDVSTEQCMDRLKKGVRPGSIIVLHDSARAFSRLRQLLPAALRYFRESNFHLRPLPC